MKNILKYARGIPLILLYIYYRFIKNGLYESILKLGVLILILLISLNIFIYVKYHTEKKRISNVITFMLIIMIAIITLVFLISLFLNWNQG